MSRGRGLSMFRVSLIGLVVAVFTYAFFIRGDWLEAQIQRERAEAYSTLGPEAAGRAERRAQRWFSRAFIEPGLVEGSYAITAVGDGDGVAAELLDWAGERIRVWWLMLLQVFTRLSLASVWWPYTMLVVVPFVIDALTARKIKTSTFGITSPHTFTVARLLLVVTPFIFVVLLLAPWYMPVAAAPLASFTGGLALWAAISQFAKRA